MPDFKPLYAATATASGGREGKARSSDGILDLTLTTPKELGGSGGVGTNPEQLFAAGYAACFLSAIKVVAREMKLNVPADTTVECTVAIGEDDGSFGLRAELTVRSPDMDQAVLRRVVDAAHQVCPYSRATRDNIDVELSVAA
ncbi:organic hydroperoxide resistance protein [Luteimonas salinilitoris]|uniref:Organic hydroperoxide resistance protein n=1 Tax=Luteimonas salinilitoris TaxID=3237697 RepID=A0ABV4HRA6_9GAMM